MREGKREEVARNIGWRLRLRRIALPSHFPSRHRAVAVAFPYRTTRPNIFPMFTGIVEKTAAVIAVADGAGFVRLTIAADWPDVLPGESIAVNGVCLTVAELAPGKIGFD